MAALRARDSRHRPAPTAASHHGWLMKRATGARNAVGFLLPNWKKRYFVLFATELRWYEGASVKGDGAAHIKGKRLGSFMLSPDSSLIEDAECDKPSEPAHTMLSRSPPDGDAQFARLDSDGFRSHCWQWDRCRRLTDTHIWDHLRGAAGTRISRAGFAEMQLSLPQPPASHRLPSILRLRPAPSHACSSSSKRRPLMSAPSGSETSPLSYFCPTPRGGTASRTGGLTRDTPVGIGHLDKT